MIVGDERRADIATATGFDSFFEAEYGRTVRLARLLTGSAAVAEDMAQEAFMAIYRVRDQVTNPPGFLRTATVNLCRNWHRSRGREAARLARALPVDEALSPAAREMDEMVQALPYRQRAVLVLRYWLDLPEVEIAAALGCRPGTVKSLHARALDRLRRGLA